MIVPDKINQDAAFQQPACAVGEGALYVFMHCTVTAVLSFLHQMQQLSWKLCIELFCLTFSNLYKSYQKVE